MYSAARRRIEGELRRAAKRGLPQWSQDHAAMALRQAERARNNSAAAAAREDRQRYYRRALDILDQLGDMLAAFRTAVESAA